MDEPDDLPGMLQGADISHKCTVCSQDITLTIDSGDSGDRDQIRYLGRCDTCRLHYAVVVTTFLGIGINS